MRHAFNLTHTLATFAFGFSFAAAIYGPVPAWTWSIGAGTALLLTGLALTVWQERRLRRRAAAEMQELLRRHGYPDLPA